MQLEAVKIWASIKNYQTSDIKILNISKKNSFPEGNLSLNIKTSEHYGTISSNNLALYWLSITKAFIALEVMIPHCYH